MKAHKKRAPHRRFNAHKNHVPNDMMDILIEAINESDLGWKADTCMLQKHHHMYGAHCEKPLELVQTKGEEEEETPKSLTFGKGPDFPKAVEQA
jgi:hypothetical protein